jgi:hypothetical protein
MVLGFKWQLPILLPKSGSDPTVLLKRRKDRRYTRLREIDFPCHDYTEGRLELNFADDVVHPEFVEKYDPELEIWIVCDNTHTES